MNNWCLVFLLTILTLVGKKGGSAETGGSSCPAVSPSADQLRLKIDELEANLSKTKKEAGTLKRNIHELKNEVQKQADELSKSAEKRTELKESEKKCKEDLGKTISDLGTNDKQHRIYRKAESLCKAYKEKTEEEFKLLTAELELARSVGKPDSPGGEDVESLKEKMGNCEETAKAVRERCDQESEELKRIGKTHERIRTSLDNCTERTKVCDGERDHLRTVKEGYDVIVKQLEEQTQNAKDSKERYEDKAKEAIRGASKYQFWLAGIGVVALIGITIQLYRFVKGKMAERVATLAAAKQKEKLETKRKGTTTKREKKQS